MTESSVLGSMGVREWAESEFGDADLGDVRRTQRVVTLTAEIASRPDGRVTAVVKSSAEREAAFRLLRNRTIDPAELASGIDHYLRPGAARRAAHRPERARKLIVRAAPVRVRLTECRPKYKVTEMDLWVVCVREKDPPRSSERLEWFLQTTYPIHSKEDAFKVVRAYCLRWRVEEFHKTWKSGACKIETSQLRSPQTFKLWATLHATVAARIERLKHYRNSFDASAREVASRSEIDAAILLTARCRWKPGDELNAAEFVLLVANLGGYTGKSSGGPPGSIVIRRGFDQVLAASRALEAKSQLNKCD